MTSLPTIDPDPPAKSAAVQAAARRTTAPLLQRLLLSLLGGYAFT